MDAKHQEQAQTTSQQGMPQTDTPQRHNNRQQTPNKDKNTHNGHLFNENRGPWQSTVNAYSYLP